MSRRASALTRACGDAVRDDRARVPNGKRTAPIDPVSQLLRLQETSGNAAVVALLSGASDLPPLGESGRAVSSALTNDTGLERQADAVAQSVVGDTAATPPLDRMCAASESTLAARTDGLSTSAREGIAAPGRPLDSRIRALMEARLGHDLSAVRVHVGDAAERAVRDLDATAYTAGSHIVIDRSHYAPETSAGRLLLAHELTHVVQQSGSPSGGVHEGGETSISVGVSNAPSGAVQRQAATRDELQKRLEQVRRELSTGSGVRTNEATAKLQEDEARLTAQLQQANADELRRQLEANRKQQANGSGVRSPQTAAQLKAEEERLQQRLSPVTATGGPAMQASNVGGPTAAPNAPFVDWGGGNSRGLGAEPAVIKSSYPGAVQLPANFPGADLVQGGAQTPLTGFGRSKGVKLPLSSDSMYVEGGTLIQVKTMKNLDPSYQKPNALFNELGEGLEKLADVGAGAGRSEGVGQEVRRVELGQPSRKILHVELEAPPTPDQLAQLEQLKWSGKEFGKNAPGEEVEVVVNWPGSQPKSFYHRVGSALGRAAGPTSIGLAAAGMYSRPKWSESQLKQEGYAARGVTAHQGSGAAASAGAFARGDSFDLESGAPTSKDIDYAVWQARVRERANAKKPGERLTITWQLRLYSGKTRDVDVTYEKNSDGLWQTGVPSDDMEGCTVPDLNRIVSPTATPQDVARELNNCGA